MKKRVIRYYRSMLLIEFVFFLAILLGGWLYFYEARNELNQRITNLNSRLLYRIDSQEKEIKNHILSIKEHSEKIRVFDTQIGAIRRNLNNQADELNKLSEVTTEIVLQNEANEAQPEAGDIPENNVLEKNVVEMEVPEDYQIKLPESQKVFRR